MKKEKQDPDSVKDRIAKKIAGGIIGAQLALSNRLGRLERRLSITAKKVLLILFCIIGGIYCSLVLTHAVLPGDRHNVSSGYAVGVDRLPKVKKLPGHNSGGDTAITIKNREHETTF